MFSLIEKILIGVLNLTTRATKSLVYRIKFCIMFSVCLVTHFVSVKFNLTIKFKYEFVF